MSYISNKRNEIRLNEENILKKKIDRNYEKSDKKMKENKHFVRSVNESDGVKN